MPHLRFSSEDIYERGERIYAEYLRSQVETEVLVVWPMKLHRKLTIQR
jgi:hypothetical protein